MKYKSYPKYKDSGVLWIGIIPDHWKILRIKHTTYVKGRIGWQGLRFDEFTDEGPFLVTGTDFIDGRINWESCYHITEERYLEDPFIQLKENDLLITKDGTIGKIAIVEEMPGVASLNSGVFVTRAIKPVYTTGYMYWALSSDVFNGFIESQKTGTTIAHLYQNVFVEFSYPAPPINEQQKIVNYIDRNIEKIDTLLTKKRALIEKLKEKRTALISRTVTRGLPPEAARAAGLDPHPKLKPSGVEWLGDVPKHWDILEVRRVSRLIKTGSTPPTAQDEYYEEGTVPWYGPGSFNEQTVLDTPVKFINESAVKSGAARLFRAGSTMVVGIGATLGKVSSIVSPASCNQQITVIEFDERRVFHKFGTYQLKQLETILRSIAPSATLPILSQGDIADIVMALPPLEEQRTITDFLDIELKEIKKLIEKIEVVIDRLQEYRTAVITAAVTGKIDVRETEA